MQTEMQRQLGKSKKPACDRCLFYSAKEKADLVAQKEAIISEKNQVIKSLQAEIDDLREYERTAHIKKADRDRLLN